MTCPGWLRSEMRARRYLRPGFWLSRQRELRLLSYLLGKSVQRFPKEVRTCLMLLTTPTSRPRTSPLSRWKDWAVPLLDLLFDDRLISSLITYMGALCIIRRDPPRPYPRPYTAKINNSTDSSSPYSRPGSAIICIYACFQYSTSAQPDFNGRILASAPSHHTPNSKVRFPHFFATVPKSLPIDAISYTPIPSTSYMRVHTSQGPEYILYSRLETFIFCILQER